jgi:hypothetical protein
MKAPKDKEKTPRKVKAEPRLSDDLQRSRKHKLWMRANWSASIVIAIFFVLALLRMVSEVGGEYVANCPSLHGTVACSIVHSDKDIRATLSIPRTPILVCTVSDQNIGENVDWQFQTLHKGKSTEPVHFKGTVESSSMTGIVQDGIRIFPVKLEKDCVATLTRQLTGFVPNNQ